MILTFRIEVDTPFGQEHVAYIKHLLKGSISKIDDKARVYFEETDERLIALEKMEYEAGRLEL